MKKLTLILLLIGLFSGFAYASDEQELIDLDKARFKEYQEWVLEKCAEAMNFYEPRKLLFSDDEAIAMFYNFDLKKVDHSLLSPEVSRVFNFVLQKILKELRGEKAFEIEKEMAMAEKKTREDF